MAEKNDNDEVPGGVDPISYHMHRYFKKMYKEFASSCPVPTNEEVQRFVMEGKGIKMYDMNAFKEWYVSRMAMEEVYPQSIANDYGMPLDTAEIVYGLFDNPQWPQILGYQWPLMVAGNRGAPENELRVFQQILVFGYEDGTVANLCSVMHKDLRAGEDPINDVDVVQQVLHQPAVFVKRLTADSIDRLHHDMSGDGQFFTSENVEYFQRLVQDYIDQQLKTRSDIDQGMVKKFEQLNTFYFKMFQNRIPDQLKQHHKAVNEVNKHKAGEATDRPRGGFA